MVRAILFPQGRRSRSKRNNSPVVDFLVVVVDSDASTFNVVVFNDSVVHAADGRVAHQAEAPSGSGSTPV